MDSYFDIKALPNPEILQSAVVAHLMQQLHRVLPQYEGRIGLSFPAYGQQRTLGGIIRVLGVKVDIDNVFHQLNDMVEVKDYGLITPVSVIPSSVEKHAFFTRVHAKGKSRFERLKKRHLERGTWTNELEVAASEKMRKPLHYPHVSLKSASTGETFLLFLNRRLCGLPVEGVFNGYGLSKTATVPWF
jgi:CRISPR-associated endonuclease Csy4